MIPRDPAHLIDLVSRFNSWDSYPRSKVVDNLRYLGKSGPQITLGEVYEAMQSVLFKINQK